MNTPFRALAPLLCVSFLALAACASSPPSVDDSTTDLGSTGTGPGMTELTGGVTTSRPTEAQGEPLFVDAATVDCEGEGPMKCLRVRSSESEEWRLLYGSIEGFEHQAGNVYELRVTKRSVKNPPADAASSKLVLVEVVSKKPAPKP